MALHSDGANDPSRHLALAAGTAGRAAVAAGFDSGDASAHVDRILAVVRHGLSSSHGDPVAGSWTRCVNEYRLDPARARIPAMLGGRELRELRERLADVIDCAKLEMTSLYQQLGDPECAVVLTGRGGEILHMVSAPSFEKEVAPLGLRVGAVWSEREAGTNGMGTCAAIGAPVAVCRTDHFFPQYASLTCSAVPVYDQEGQISAVLDVTSRSALPQQHSLVLLGMTAQTIENRLLDTRFRHAFPVHFHSRPEFVYTLQAGRLVIDADGRVLAANRNALFQLGLRSLQEIRGRPFEEVFQSPLDDLLRRSLASSFHPVPLYAVRASHRFFGVAQQPASVIDAPPRPSLSQPALPARVRPAADVPSDIVFGDPRIGEQFGLARRVIARGIPLLLHGETGVGKEVFAKAVHAASPRAAGAFVAVNCASLPETLIESELFGYRAGAFTGAQRTGRRGKILQADKGTMFLDEIGDMPLALQARLLRVLDERRVTPLGTEESYEVDFQLISASHRNLEDAVRSGQFREDLYYRLGGVVITLPPLRERSDERELIRRIMDEEGAQVELTAEAEAALLAHPWPGNVRQLRHVLRALAALHAGETVDREQVLRRMRSFGDECAASASARIAASPGAAAAPAVPPTESEHASAAGAPPDDDPEAAERCALLRVLEQHRWNMSNVARALAISRNTLYRRMHRCRIPLSHQTR